MTAIATTAQTAPRGGRPLRTGLWVFQVLLALFLLFSASAKLFSQEGAVETFELIGWGEWFQYLTGAVEAAGAIGLLIPRLVGPASIGLIGLMAGAMITHVTVLDTPGWALLPFAFALVLALVAWTRWPETRALAGGR